MDERKIPVLNFEDLNNQSAEGFKAAMISYCDMITEALDSITQTVLMARLGNEMLKAIFDNKEEK